MDQPTAVGDLRQSPTEFKVLQAVSGRWPSEGFLRFEVPGLTGEISVSPDLARRRAAGRRLVRFRECRARGREHACPKPSKHGGHLSSVRLPHDEPSPSAALSTAWRGRL